MSTEHKIRTSKRLTNSKEHRDAFVASHIKEGLPFQIRALRKQRKWTQKDLGKKARFNQSKVSDFENPNYSSDLNLDTVKRLASAFDVALIVRFVSFGDLIGWTSDLVPGSLDVPSFDDDPQCREWLEAPSNTMVARDISIVIVETPVVGSTVSETHTQMFPEGPVSPSSYQPMA